MKKNGFVRNRLVAIALLMVLAVVAGVVFARYGGFGTGKCADTEAFAQYAAPVDSFSVPGQVRIVALGEASHGNADFQQMKLDVFKMLVEKHGVRAFALEGDYGGCEAVNRYIHGGGGPLTAATDAIGFTLYRTAQMDSLIAWMRTYNMTAPDGEDLRFYGFDMQRWEWNYRYLLEAAEERGIDVATLRQQNEDKEAHLDQWLDAIVDVKHELEQQEGTANAVHHADILLQNCGYGKTMGQMNKSMAFRDSCMAENVRWILAQEETRGNRCIMVAAHNGHIGRSAASHAAGKNMGSLLADAFGDAYFAIGTDFYKSRCNLPANASRTSRANHLFYSHDPLAKAAMKCGLASCWLDFSKIPASSPLRQQVDGPVWMGSIGEGYSPLMALLPRSYRVWDSPARLYDGMLFVAEAQPTSPRQQ